MNQTDVLEILEQRQEEKWSLGLGRVSGCLSRLGDPHLKVPAIHVAGTNGKGSVCSLFGSVLKAAGYRVGLYTSPHLTDVSERIQINGRPISAADLSGVLERVLEAETEPLTYFELLTAAAFLHFEIQRVDVAVLEVGLGGRLDATNVVPRPLLSVIVSIDKDHAAILGDSLEKIATEKAGILKPGAPALCGETKEAPLRAIREQARRVGARLRVVRTAWKQKDVCWSAGTQTIEEERGGIYVLRLLGEHQIQNASIVIEGIKMLREEWTPISEQAVREGFRSVRWPGRFDVQGVAPNPRRRRLILDGAHNPRAMEAFLRCWSASPWSREPGTFIVGFLKDKDSRAMLSSLCGRASELVLTTPPSSRAIPAEALRLQALEYFPAALVSEVPDPYRALDHWRLSGRRVGVVCGSFYLVGAAMRWLKARAARPVSITP